VDYVGLLTPHHVALLHDWITELGELYVYIEYPHSGGGGIGYLVQDLENIRDLISQQTHPEIEISIFRAIVFPIRGKDPSALLQRALREIPEGQYFQIVTTAPYPHECQCLGDGQGHDELRRVLADLAPGQQIGIGVHPFDAPHKEFEQFCGTPVQKLYFEVHKNLNSYAEFIKDPSKYKDAMARWAGFTKPE
jgi:hypothetical protein